MPISELIQRAVDATFPADQRPAVIAALQRIPPPDSDSLQQRPSVELLQAAALVLAHGDRAILDEILINAEVEPRDVIYSLQSPEVVRPNLNATEVLRRYQALRLPIPEFLAANG